MIRALTEAEVTFTVEAEEEDLPIEGNVLASGDDDADREAEREIREDLEQGNPWAWCCVKVTATWKDWTGTDYLGACSYASEKDFVTEDGYYPDMRARALEALNASVAASAEALACLREERSTR